MAQHSKNTFKVNATKESCKVNHMRGWIVDNKTQFLIEYGLTVCEEDYHEIVLEDSNQ